MFDTYLRGTHDMSCGMERYTNAVDRTSLAVGDTADDGGASEPMTKDGNAIVVREIGAHSGAGMIAVRMRDHGPVDGAEGGSMKKSPAGQ